MMTEAKPRCAWCSLAEELHDTKYNHTFTPAPPAPPVPPRQEEGPTVQHEPFCPRLSGSECACQSTPLPAPPASGERPQTWNVHFSKHTGKPDHFHLTGEHNEDGSQCHGYKMVEVVPAAAYDALLAAWKRLEADYNATATENGDLRVKLAETEAFLLAEEKANNRMRADNVRWDAEFSVTKNRLAEAGEKIEELRECVEDWKATAQNDYKALWETDSARLAEVTHLYESSAAYKMLAEAHIENDDLAKRLAEAEQVVEAARVLGKQYLEYAQTGEAWGNLISALALARAGEGKP